MLKKNQKFEKVVLCADNVIKNFSCGFCALNNVSLKIYPRTITCIVGESGSGKTTLLKTLSSLEKASCGSVNSPKSITTSYTSQIPTLFPHMSVYENVKIASTKKSKKDIIRELREWNIEHKLNSFPQDLSGGEQQKVCLARHFIRNPNISLLDEPFSQIDASQKRYFRYKLLHKISQSNQSAAVIVTHDFKEAWDIANRIIVIHKGEIIQQGSCSNIVNKPNSVHSARISGEYNECIGKKIGNSNFISTPLMCIKRNKVLDREMHVAIKSNNVTMSNMPTHPSQSEIKIISAIPNCLDKKSMSLLITQKNSERELKNIWNIHLDRKDFDLLNKEKTCFLKERRRGMALTFKMDHPSFFRLE